MRRQLISAALIVALLIIAAPVWAASPIGFFGGQTGGRNAGDGLIPVHGWALDDDGVEAVDIMVDGVIMGRALYGLPRPDVAALFPGFPNSNAAGFGFELDSTQFGNGLHAVTAKVTTRSGETKRLNVRGIEFLNAVQNLAPFGAIDFPARNANLFGNCSLADPNRRYSVITGWALDMGVSESDRGVGYVELLLDGSIIANSRRDCFFGEDEGGLSNCYGLRRFDVEFLYPHAEDAPNSGFRFVLDIGFLMEVFLVTPGQHVLTVRSGDVSNQVTNIAEVPVTFFCDDFIDNEGSFGAIDQPRFEPALSGIISIFGWALDREGVDQVLLYVDGGFAGEADFGLPRSDVHSAFPGYPDSARAGWFAFFATSLVGNGEHQVQVIVRDNFGEETLIGERKFLVANP